MTFWHRAGGVWKRVAQSRGEHGVDQRVDMDIDFLIGSLSVCGTLAILAYLLYDLHISGIYHSKLKVLDC